MINDMKKAISLVKYGFQAKMQLISVTIFVLLGVLLELITRGNYWIGAFFIIVAPMYFGQLLYSMGMSNLVAASPLKKRLQTSLPTIGNCVFEVVSLSLIVVIKFIEINMHPEEKTANLAVLFMVGVMCLFLNLYSAIIYKYYALSMVLLIIPVMIISALFTNQTLDGWKAGAMVDFVCRLNFAGTALIGYLSIAVGGLIQYFLSKALYKKPLSEYAQGMMMRKYLKG